MATYPVRFRRFDFLDKHSPVAFYFENGFSAGLMHDTCKGAGLTKTEALEDVLLVIGSRQGPDVITHRLKKTQRITHFTKTHVVGIKAGLHILMSRFALAHGAVPSFYPRSFLIPDQIDSFRKEFGNGKFWIEKPARSSCGRGIRLLSEIPEQFGDFVVVQEYIRNPLLIRGYKFDLRFYVAVLSLNPLVIYNYENGLVRLATDLYCESFEDPTNLCAHLTNFAINKEQAGFKKTDEAGADGTGSKWSHEPFWPFMKELEYDTEQIRKDIDDAIVLTLMCARNDMIHGQKNHRCAFELYGFDILIDADGGVHVLEVNISPALGRSSQLDIDIKTPLVRDWLNMSLIPERDAAAEAVEEVFELRDKSLAHFVTIAEMEIADSRKGAFRRIYPTVDRLKTHAKYIGGQTSFDKQLAKYVRMSDSEKHEYMHSMSPLLNKFVSDGCGEVEIHSSGCDVV